MRLTQKEIRQINRRKKYWKSINANFPSSHYFKKNHSFNCGCSICRYNTFEKRYRNKSERVNNKIDLKNQIKNNKI